MLNLLVNLYLFSVDTILMSLMIVALLSQLLPCRFSFFSDNLGRVKLSAHFVDLDLHLLVLVRDIGDQADAKVLEGSLLLELEPLLLEDVHSLAHVALGEEVADEVIDDDGAFDRGSLGLAIRRAHRRLLQR